MNATNYRYPENQTGYPRTAYPNAVPLIPIFTPPKDRFVKALIVLIFFNTFCGLIALVYSHKVRSNLRNDNKWEALRCAKEVNVWCNLGISIGVICQLIGLLIIIVHWAPQSPVPGVVVGFHFK